MRFTFRTLVGFACALALLGAGCGGDDDDNQADAYNDAIAALDAICQSVDDLGEGLTGDPANDAPILEEVAPRFEEAIQDLSEVDVPEELETPRDEFVENAEQQLELVEQAQQQAEEGDRQAYRDTLREGQAVDEEGEEIARELGAEECIN